MSRADSGFGWVGVFLGQRPGDVFQALPLGLDPKEELGLAPAEAKNSTANQQAVIVVAFSEPVWNR